MREQCLSTKQLRRVTLKLKSDFNLTILSCYVERRCSNIRGALVFVVTGLNQKSDNFKVTELSCYVKRRCSIICGALVFVGTRLNQKSNNFKVTVLSCYVKSRCRAGSLNCISTMIGVWRKSLIDGFCTRLLSV